MEKPSTARIAIKWGIISAIISIVFAIVIYNTDLWKSSWISFVFGSIISITLLVLAMKEFRGLNEQFMTFGEGFGLGMLLSTVSGLLSSAFNIIYTNFIDTGFQKKMMDLQEEKMIEQGLSDEQISAAMEMGQKFSTPGFQFLFSIIAILFFGAILSSIVAAIMQKKRPMFT